MPRQQKKPASKNSPKLKVTAQMAKPGRLGSKSSIILQLLNRENGATVAELAAAAKWQEHSVRGFMSGTLKKKRGLDVISQIVNGTRHYSVRSGSGAR